MTTIQRLERDLPGILEELYLGPPPSYRDDIVRRIAATAQRPGWSFPARWLPMTVFTERVAASRLSWRTIAVLGLLVVALLAAARLVGSQERRLPEPFGPAANGLIAYSFGKDIYVGDPTTGTTTAIVTGPEEDTGPVFAPDGSRIAFLRRHSLFDPLTDSDIVTVRPDGSDLRVITTERTFHDFAWAPDSASVVSKDGAGRTLAFDAGGVAPPRELALGVAGPDGQFGSREPNGDRWLSPDGGEGWATLTLMNADGSVARVLVDRSAGLVGVWSAAWSPDASRIAFVAAATATPWTPCTPWPYACDDARVHVVSADGSGLGQVSRSSAGAGSGTVVFEVHPAWSPDGTRIAFGRRTFTPSHGDRPTAWDARAPDEATQLIVVEVDTGAERDIEVGDAFYTFEWSPWTWSPDGRSLLVRAWNRSLFTVDPLTGRTQTLPWEAQDAPSWQRLADD